MTQRKNSCWGCKMINSVISLLMTYFPDNRPVTLKTLEKKCNPEVIDEAINDGYIHAITKNADEVLLVITQKGYAYRNK